MGLFDFITSELIDIIEWMDGDKGTLVHRYERHDNEIKNGAQLIVREGQVAVFVNEGEAQQRVDMKSFEPADVFTPGTYTLETANLPVLSTLKGWKHGFDSPFKAEVYFFNTTRFTDQKWGTPNPIMLRDPEFGPVRIRAFGAYSLRIKDAPTLLRELVGTNAKFSVEDISDQLRNIIITRFTDVIGESKIPVLDLAANYDELGGFIMERISGDFEEYGLALTKLLISNISLPPAVEKALDKRTQMGVLGDLGKYTQFQAAEAMEKAAENPGGMASEGLAMGAAMAMANQMGQSFQQPQQQAAPAAAAPPPPPAQKTWHLAINGQTLGPYDMNALRQQVSGGQLKRETMVWSEGMSGWTAASQVAELSGLFGAMPPPPPPPA
ncbi:MAG: SPFH domain-containing protein [Pseudomonadota bacterium]